MKETGIIMSGNHPRLILDGQKTMTRRTWGLGEINKNPDDFTFRGVNTLGEYVFEQDLGDGTTILKYIRCPYRDYSVRIQPIPRLENYGAGDDGNIYRISGQNPRKLEAWLGGYKGNYQMVRIGYGNERENYYVHRLVCEAFYGGPYGEFIETRHLDGNTTNNTPPNLDWGTPRQNALDRHVHGRLSGENNPLAKLNWGIVQEIKLTRKHSTIPELAQKYNVTHGTIEKVIYGQT